MRLDDLIARARALMAEASPLPWSQGQKMEPGDWALATLAVNLSPALLDVAEAASAWHAECLSAAGRCPEDIVEDLPMARAREAFEDALAKLCES